MVVIGEKQWPAPVPVLTPAQLPDGTVVNLLARAEEFIIYVAAVYPSPADAPRLTYGRVKPNLLFPIKGTLEAPAAGR